VARLGAKMMIGLFKPALGFLRVAEKDEAVVRRGGLALTRTAERGGGRSLRDALGSLRQRSRTFASRTTTKDPIDVVSGEVVLQQIDVRLDGALPLVLERRWAVPSVVSEPVVFWTPG
jgi:uncharacterized protein DUF6531